MRKLLMVILRVINSAIKREILSYCSSSKNFQKILLDGATITFTSDNDKLIFWLDFNVLQEAFYLKRESG